MLDSKAHLKLTGYYQQVGGVNINVSELLQRDSELKMAINVITDKLGVTKKVASPLQFGSVLINNNSILSGFVFIDNNGVAHKLAGINNYGSISQSASASASISASRSPSASPSISPSTSPSASPSTGTSSASSSASASPSASRSPSASPSASYSPSGSVSSSASWSTPPDTQILYEVTANSNSAKKSDFTADAAIDFESLLGYLFCTNDSDPLATTTDLASWGTVNAVGAPRGKFIEEFNNEPYIAGNSANKQRVYKGKLLNPDLEALAYISGDQTSATTTTITVDSTKYITPGMKIDIYTKYSKTKVTNADSLTVLTVPTKTTFTIASTNLTMTDSDEIYLEDCYNPSVIRIVWDTQGEDYFDLPPNGEEITGIKKHANRLIIFQDNSMFRWDGAVLTPISDTIGCSSSKSIFILDQKLYFIHKGVIYEYDGSYPVPISQKIQPILDSVSDYSKTITTGDDAKKRVMFYLGDIDCEELVASDVWAVYYPLQTKWEFKKDINATCAFVDKTGTGSSTMYIGDENGKLYNFESGNVAPMGYELTTKYECQGRPETVKNYAFIVTKCKKPGGHLYYALNESDDYKSLGEITKRTQTFGLPQGTKGTDISIRWTDKETGESPEFKGYAILYSEAGIE